MGLEGLDQFCFKIGGSWVWRDLTNFVLKIEGTRGISIQNRGEVRGSHPVVGNRVFYTKIFHIRVSNFSMK